MRKILKLTLFYEVFMLMLKNDIIYAQDLQRNVDKTIKQSGGAIILIFIIIIILLVINILKRRKMQVELEESKKKLQKNFQFLRVMLDTIPNPIFYKDAQGKYIDVNTTYTEYIGLKKEEIINHTVYDINQGNFAHYHHWKDANLIKNKGKQNYECKVKCADGVTRDVLFSKAALASDGDEVEGIVGVMLDITERKKIEERINRLSKLKEAMIEVSQSIIGMDNIEQLFDLILDKAIGAIEGAKIGTILVLKENNMLEVIAAKGYDAEKAQNFSIPLKHSFQWIKTKGKIENTIIFDDIDQLQDIKTMEPEEQMEGWVIKSCISTPIMINNQVYGLLNIDSNNVGVFNEEDVEIMEYLRGQIEIAIKKHKLYEEMMYLSRYDKLTNVYNRRYFEEIFDKHFQRAIRHNEEFCLVIFDLNGLKIVNDTYGHLAGDLYIKAFAKNLSNRIRTSDILARYGGDEFVGVFFKTDYKKLVMKFEKLAKDFKNNPILFEENHIVCSFSYGIANFPNDAKVYNQLVKIADERMYKYKQEIKSKMKR